MALIKCSECGNVVSDKVNFCPKCGCPIQNKTFAEAKNKNTTINRLLYGDNEITKGQSETNSKKKDYFGSLHCPKCKGHNIDLWSNSVNTKDFSRTGLNLNPLHPLTPFKTKHIKKEKISFTKIGLGVMTGGTSLLLTGIKKKKHNEYYCRDCGHRWVGK